MIHPGKDPKIYIGRKGKTYGPYGYQRVISLLNEGRLSLEDFGWSDKQGGEWVKLDVLLGEFNKVVEPESGVSTEILDEILEHLDNHDFEYALDMVKGIGTTDLYYALLEGVAVEDGEIRFPEWVGWEEKRISFFLKMMDTAPGFEHLVEIRKQTQIMDISCQEGTEFFPSEILQFDNLRFFRLWGGTLKTLPPGISKLTALETLCLEHCNISTLPNHFENLEHLKNLNLSGNSFKGVNANLEVLAKLTNLESLDLSYCQLKFLPPLTFSSLSGMKKISLKENSLDGESLWQIFDELSKIPNLEEISMENCEIRNLPEITSGFENLIKLNLENNKIKSLPGFIARLPNLKWIGLSGNPIFAELNEHDEENAENGDIEGWNEDAREDEVSGFAFSHLNSRNHYQFDELEAASPDTIHLSEVSQRKVEEFEGWMQELASMDPDPTWIDKKIDELISLGDDYLLVEIMRGCTLEKGGVLITGSHFPFPYWVSGLFPSTSLHHDSQSDWSETGWGGDVKSRDAAGFHYLLLRLIPRLPKHPAVDPSLRIENVVALDLCLPGVLPSEIGRFRNLRELSITKNSLREIPDEISQLTNLEILQLDNNQLKNLPSSVCALENLKYLGLTANLIQEVSPKIGGLRNLEVLDFSSNKIAHLPMEIGNLNELMFLGLKGNELRNLPPEIWTLYKLRHLWIGKNPIDSLPEEIYEMEDLEVFGIYETSCLPEKIEWVLDREVFLSSNTKSMMLIREKDQNLLQRLKKELKVWN